MSIVVIDLQNLVGLGKCTFSKATGKTTCPKVTSVCPVGSKPDKAEKNCTTFDPCANAGAAKLNSQCKQKKGCTPVAAPSGKCTPVKSDGCIVSYTCGLLILV